MLERALQMQPRRVGVGQAVVKLRDFDSER